MHHDAQGTRVRARGFGGLEYKLIQRPCKHEDLLGWLVWIGLQHLMRLSSPETQQVLYIGQAGAGEEAKAAQWS